MFASISSYPYLTSGATSGFVKSRALITFSSRTITPQESNRREEWLLKEVLSFDHHDSTSSTPLNGFDREMEELLKQQKVPVLGLGIIQKVKLCQVGVYSHLKRDTGVSALAILFPKTKTAMSFF